MKKMFIMLVSVLICGSVYSADMFYVELNQGQAKSLIENGMNQLFGNTKTNSFDDYCLPIQDSSTGKLYWKVEDVQKRKSKYACRVFLRGKGLGLTEYSQSELNAILNISDSI